MERPFHKDVEELRSEVARMGRLAVLSLTEAVKALETRDPGLATRVLARDRELDSVDVRIEARILELIALHQPMAKDLRVLGASLKLITYLDRIGRYGYDIAVAALSAMEGPGPPPPPRGILLMARATERMAELALEAYEHDDPAKAHAAIEADDEVDELYDEVFRASLTYMMQDPPTIRAMTEYLLVARHLERAADNAVKVAEKALYIATGERRRRALPMETTKESFGVGHEQ
jgi:phosphate transport system protein